MSCDDIDAMWQMAFAEVSDGNEDWVWSAIAQRFARMVEEKTKADLVIPICEGMEKAKKEAAAEVMQELRAKHELIQKLKSILGGVLKCERDSDGRIVLNGWQEGVISKQLAAAEAHK